MQREENAGQDPVQVTSLWFRHHFECIETSYDEVVALHDDLRTISTNDLDTLIDMTDSFRSLAGEVNDMLKVLEAVEELPPTVSHRLHVYNNMNRISELATLTATSLDNLADQLSWGRVPTGVVADIRRNLITLKNVMDEALTWLKGMISWLEPSKALR